MPNENGSVSAPFNENDKISAFLRFHSERLYIECANSSHVFSFDVTNQGKWYIPFLADGYSIDRAYKICLPHEYKFCSKTIWSMFFRLEVTWGRSCVIVCQSLNDNAICHEFLISFCEFCEWHINGIVYSQLYNSSMFILQAYCCVC